MTTTIIANIIMFVGCILLVIAGVIADARRTVFLQTGQLLLAATANILLGAYTGAALNMVSIFRNAVVLKEKYYMPVRIAFIVIMITAGFVTNNRGMLGFGIIIGNVFFTACLGLKREEILKLALAFCIFWWAIYDFRNGNYVGAVFDVATFVSSIVGYIRITQHK